MKDKAYSLLFVTAIAAAIGLGGAGCASTPSSRAAKPLAVTMEPGTDLKSYQVATVLPFEVLDTKHADASVGAKLAEDIRDRLKYDYGELFTDVRKGPLLGQTNEIIITGSITKYAPGSRTARFILIGLGPASLEGEMVVKDAISQKTVMKAPFDKLWAWGGAAGASIGIEEMMTGVAASAASTIAHARGWEQKK